MGKTAAIILSAGSMSQGLYPLAIVNKEPLINAAISMLRTCGVDTIVVVTGDRHEIISNFLRDSGVTLLYNSNHENSQMLDSLKLALKYIQDKSDRTFLVRADVLAFSQKTVETMLSTRAEIVCPCRFGTPGHPTLISGKYYDAVLNYEGPDGLRGFLNTIYEQVSFVGVDDEGILLKNNSYENFQRIVRLKSDKAPEPFSFRPSVSVSLENAGFAFSDENAIFLDMIDKTGSIRISCDCMHISYTKGWTMINRIEAGTGLRFVNKTVGGPKGGRSHLTENGKQFLTTYMDVRKRLNQEAERLFDEVSFPTESESA